MSIQKAVASAFAVTQETSISLANLNFDFSLVRVDAPPSFKGLGNELTSSRKKAAEEGTPHVTARKLGALFLDLLPSTPALIQAYGQRVTQIASRRDVNPKSAKVHGLFAEHVGIDGTSIWAAATSGPEAIAVHLLTCLLARIWTAPEAISIWVELVAHRKRDLVAVKETGTIHLRSIEASRISISREQLAEWDASARAWLRAADEAMGVKQKQLMLILNNVNLPVNKKPSVYSSVIDAWTTSLVVVDKLVQGIPQSVKDGSVGLGLASWHIYPDMLVLGDSQKEISQKDDVVAPGALLTIGLHLRGQEQTGVHWSLPLSHLRYYGRPIVANRSLEDQANRLTLDQLILVALGSITKNWELSHEEIARGFRGLWDFVADEAPSFCAPGTTHWLGTFAKATDLLLESDKLTMESALQLMRFAERRASHFAIPYSSHYLVPSMFGLLKYKTCFDLLTPQVFEELGEEVVDIESADVSIQEDPSEVTTRVISWTESTEDLRLFSSISHERNVFSAFTVGEADHIKRNFIFLFGNSAAALFYSRQQSQDSTASLSSFKDAAFTLPGASVLYSSTEDSQNSPPSSNAFEDLVHENPDLNLHHLTGQLDLDDLATAFSSKWFDKQALLSYLHDFLSDKSRDVVRTSFRALATVSNIYKLLPDATTRFRCGRITRRSRLRNLSFHPTLESSKLALDYYPDERLASLFMETILHNTSKARLQHLITRNAQPHVPKLKFIDADVETKGVDGTNGTLKTDGGFSSLETDVRPRLVLEVGYSQPRDALNKKCEEYIVASGRVRTCIAVLADDDAVCVTDWTPIADADVCLDLWPSDFGPASSAEAEQSLSFARPPRSHSGDASRRAPAPIRIPFADIATCLRQSIRDSIQDRDSKSPVNLRAKKRKLNNENEDARRSSRVKKKLEFHL
ncbi:hypothetical protein CkaCkLH20_10352 [Colletotrichum karsti]|uniref:Uncharacterized protein n=1 Tax=Colletotrichum karsti TaxID=1095194 RepID=A0A9P6I5A9_9PEZI|nr:uncharacterized protein CkaCkLH20_10352 [Colletotrichum karsti]KAF9872260.1 hypothetical protein CkaCkLH20_10352 [Colletotrichum karsti]